MALEGVNGVGITTNSPPVGELVQGEQGNVSIYGDGYKTDAPTNEEVIKRKQNEARLQAEHAELEAKGITEPAEKAKVLMANDIDSGRLVWVPQSEALFGFIKTGGYYEYHVADDGLYGAETRQQIADRYGFDVSKIKKDGNYISPDGRIYDRIVKIKPEGMPT